jgi:pilus assembly protein CpaB
MNNRALTLSLVMAALAVFFVSNYVTSVEEDARKKYGSEVLVVVAKTDIKEMATINETHWETKRVPKKFLEPAAISFSGRELSDEDNKILKDLVKNVALVPIKKGEQLTFNKLTEPGVRTGLAPQITPGRRAITIPVNDNSGVGRLIKAGDRVDVIGILDSGKGKEGKLARTILQDVVVLAAGKSVTNNIPRVIESDGPGGKDRVRSLAEDTSYGSVTLEVEPVQAQALALVMANGDSSVYLSLRNNDDSERQNFPGTVFTDLIGADIVRLPRTGPK